MFLFGLASRFGNSRKASAPPTCPTRSRPLHDLTRSPAQIDTIIKQAQFATQNLTQLRQAAFVEWGKIGEALMVNSKSRPAEVIWNYDVSN
jgi:hypothetical protein